MFSKEKSEKNIAQEQTVPQYVSNDISSDEEGILLGNADHLHRRLGNRQIQLIAIGGSIGTALFVSIGGGLARGGPGSLFLAYAIYACFLGLVNNCIAEMTIQYPVSGGFIRLAGKFVDEAFGFMAGWVCISTLHCTYFKTFGLTLSPELLSI